MTLHRVRPRAPRAGLAALALASGLALLPAQAANRYWTFIGGCGSADWLSMTAGFNEQGRFTCWADTLGGLSGRAAPTSGDDVFIVAPGASATLLVNVAAPGRPFFLAQANDITMYGGLSFAAGLALDRHAMDVRSIELGASGLAFLGRMDQSGGTLTASTEVAVLAGEYRLSGGSLNTSQLTLRSQAAAATFTQSGGSLTAGTVSLGGDLVKASTYRQTGGQVNSSTLNVGFTTVGTGTWLVTVGGGSTRWDNSGTMRIGNNSSGSLEVTDGARVTTASATLGVGPLADGRVSVTGAGAYLQVGGPTAGSLLVGDGGKGVLEVGNGGNVRTFDLTFNGSTVPAGATPSVVGRFSGAGSVVGVTNILTIGQTRGATLDIGDGATLQSIYGVIGDRAGVAGLVRLSGSGGNWINNGTLLIGNEGSGRIEVGAGSLLHSTDAYLGWWFSTEGSVLLSGAQARWTNDNTLTVGTKGAGSLTLLAGAQLDSGSTVIGLTNTSAGDATVSGAGSQWRNGGLLQVGGAGYAQLRVADRGTVTTGEAQIGNGSTVTVTGAASTFNVTQLLNVANSIGKGRLEVLDGALVTSGSVIIGNSAGGSGEVQVGGGSASAPLSTWRTAGLLRIGVLGAGLLNIGVQGLVESTGQTSTGSSGRLVLDGGTLRSAEVLLGDPSRMDWRSGTLQVTGSAGVALDGVALPQVLTVPAQGLLQVDRTLRLTPDSTLRLAGGRVAAGTLTLDNATLMTSGAGVQPLQMDGIGLLSGQGVVAVPLAGGAANRIRATGELTLGLAARSDGYAYAGTLELGQQQVVLLDRDLAELGVLTTLSDGAQLATINGARLNSGGRLQAAGSTSVQGRFVNDGAVVADSGQLSFINDVSGSGSFAGSVRFLAGYAPGNSTAAVSFGGGRASFGSNARLTLEVNSTTPGSGFDQLLEIGTLSFEGTLMLAFGSGFSAAPGSRLALLGFDAFQGRMNAAQVVVSGYDVQRLDLSRLAIDGTVTITAVPEPGVWAMWMAGLGVVALRFKRPRQTRRSA